MTMVRNWCIFAVVCLTILSEQKRTHSFVDSLPPPPSTNNNLDSSLRFKRQEYDVVEEEAGAADPGEPDAVDPEEPEPVVEEEEPVAEVEDVVPEEEPVGEEEEVVPEEEPVGEEEPVAEVEEAVGEEEPEAEEAVGEEEPEAEVEEAVGEEEPEAEVEEAVGEEEPEGEEEEVILEEEDEVEDEGEDEAGEDIIAILAEDGLQEGSGEEGSGEEASGEEGSGEEDSYTEAVLEAPPLEDEVTTTPIPAPACFTTPFGCCSLNDTVPSHGHREEGCCLLNTHGCCPDLVTPAAGPGFDGCFCGESDFGCCPDEVTAARGPDNLGCGCMHMPHGCCPDQVTAATGPDMEGCPCQSYEFGCCPDGQTTAEGPNLEGCSDCTASEHGCCPDGYTPAESADCGCAGSATGCCPDGQTTAEGPNFAGCGEMPGESCHLPKSPSAGDCRENFTVQWFFDMDYGGCSRFWHSDCGDKTSGNGNRFGDHATCEAMCIKPPGSGRCYLPKVRGPCEANYQNWYFDRQWNQCMEFEYGGCLGNANRFESKQECQEACLRTPDDVAVCEQPFEPGPCRGEYGRWYYDAYVGHCRAFNYTGCMGNANRFMSEDECENSCRHHSQITIAKTRCAMHKKIGHCKDKEAKWYFDTKNKGCLPFYYSGCGGNDNRFDSWDECEEACPNAFPPEVEVTAKVVVVEEGLQALLEVTVEANPPPTVTWQVDGADVELSDRIVKLPDGSLNITESQMDDTGTWTIVADNGLGQVARKQIALKVHPSRMPIEVTVDKEKALYKDGEDINVACQVKGYPIPAIRWYKNNMPLKKSGRLDIYDDNTLVITGATTIDGGVYTCRATNEHESVSDRLDIKVEKGVVQKQCQDKPSFARCDLIVKANFCNRNPYYAEFCCASCTEAGQLGPGGVMITTPPPPPAEEPEAEIVEMDQEEADAEETEAAVEETEEAAEETEEAAEETEAAAEETEAAAEETEAAVEETEAVAEETEAAAEETEAAAEETEAAAEETEAAAEETEAAAEVTEVAAEETEAAAEETEAAAEETEVAAEETEEAAEETEEATEETEAAAEEAAAEE